jgi:hypothetical protein
MLSRYVKLPKIPKHSATILRKPSSWSKLISAATGSNRCSQSLPRKGGHARSCTRRRNRAYAACNLLKKTPSALNTGFRITLVISHAAQKCRKIPRTPIFYFVARDGVLAAAAPGLPNFHFGWLWCSLFWQLFCFA